MMMDKTKVTNRDRASNFQKPRNIKKEKRGWMEHILRR